MAEDSDAYAGLPDHSVHVPVLFLGQSPDTGQPARLHRQRSLYSVVAAVHRTRKETGSRLAVLHSRRNSRWLALYDLLLRLFHRRSADIVASDSSEELAIQKWFKLHAVLISLAQTKFEQATLTLFIMLNPTPPKESVDGISKNSYFNQSEIDIFFAIAL